MEVFFLNRQSKFAIALATLAVGAGLAGAADAAQSDADPVAKPRHSYRSIATDMAQLHRAQMRQEQDTDAQAGYQLVGGVSHGTLDAIGACESGGDPTAVDASGTYYGKYQFDLGTWAAVGGSGNPAQAPEAEQDYRASVLYSRAGSSPWPVCGV